MWMWFHHGWGTQNEMCPGQVTIPGWEELHNRRLHSGQSSLGGCVFHDGWGNQSCLVSQGDGVWVLTVYIQSH